MLPVFSRSAMRAMDARLIGNGVAGVLLMENAGRGAAEIALPMLEGTSRRVVVLAGRGNNGGDAFVVARRLRTFGAVCDVLTTNDVASVTGDARVMLDAWSSLGQGTRRIDTVDLASVLEGAALVVDGLWGTGLDRPLDASALAWIAAIRAAGRPVLSLDIPSGLDADTGKPWGDAVSATVTVTFGAHKLGLWTTSAVDYCGRVVLADIGTPIADVGHSAQLVESRDVAHRVRERRRSVHKGLAGRVAVVAGAPQTLGAATLAGLGAHRGGAGLVWIVGRPDSAALLQQRAVETMTRVLDLEDLEGSLDAVLDGMDAVVVGPGLGLDELGRNIARRVVLTWSGPMVVDADALTSFAGNLSALRNAAGRLLLTPHPGELGRLLGVTAADVEADRFSAMHRAVREAHCSVLLKGPCTLVGAPEQVPRIISTGHPAMAVGGCGDVLAGLCGALCCELDPFDAATAASWIHGQAGRAWAEETGADRGMLTRELADRLPGVFASLTRGRSALPE